MMDKVEYEIVECSPEHIVYFTDDIDIQKSNCIKGLSFTALYKGKPIGCAGIRPLWKGVGEAWVMFGPDVRSHTLFLYRNTRSYMKKLVWKYGFHRIQAYCRCDFPQAFGFLEILGFKMEGKAYKYNPDRTDAYFMALTREVE
jgi:hypothetical protein